MKDLVFTVNGVEQKIAAKLVNEVFKNDDGTEVTLSDSGEKTITDKFAGDEWIHRTVFDQHGNRSYEITRTFNEDGKIISICEECADGKTFCTTYEYDENKYGVYQKQEKVASDGTKKIFERWFKNIFDEKEFDVTKFTFEKEMCYRLYDNKGRVIRYVDSFGDYENQYDAEGELCESISRKDGKVNSKVVYYKSDDGLVKVQRYDNFEKGTTLFYIKDYRKSEENSSRIYAFYMS